MADSSLFECWEQGERFRLSPPFLLLLLLDVVLLLAVGLCASKELTDLVLSEEHDCDLSMLRGDFGLGAFSFGKSRSSWLVVFGGVSNGEVWSAGDETSCPLSGLWARCWSPPLTTVGVRGGEADSRIAWLRVKCLPLALAVCE